MSLSYMCRCKWAHLDRQNMLYGTFFILLYNKNVILQIRDFQFNKESCPFNFNTVLVDNPCHRFHTDGCCLLTYISV